jgi:hypothetical protein
LIKFTIIRIFKKRLILLFLPIFKDRLDLVDQITRLSWYLPSRYNIVIFAIYFRFKYDSSLFRLRPNYLHKRKINLENLNIVSVYNIYYLFKILILFLFNKSYIINWRKIDFYNFNFIKKKTIVVDQTICDYKSDVHYSTLPNLNFCNDLSKHEYHSYSIFKKKVSLLQNSYEKSYIFGRGPSLSNYEKYDYSDGVRIVCNQIVCNKSILKIIKPHFIVAGDHFWNMGCSYLTNLFLEDSFDWINHNDCFFVLPLECFNLISQHYPQYIDRIIGIPYGQTVYNPDLQKKFSIKASYGVFFEFLLPIASTLSNEIYMLGFDGNIPNYDNSRKVAFPHFKDAEYPDEIIKTIYETRPGYYERDLNSFRQSFDREFYEIIKKYRSFGKNIVSLEKSYHSIFNELE